MAATQTGIDQAAVDTFIAQAQAAPAHMLRPVVERMEAMIARREKAAGVSLDTMIETARRLRLMQAD